MTASPFGTLAVIADPGAGGGRVGEQLPKLEAALEGHGLEFRLAVARAAGDATRLAADALDAGFRYLAAVGDDRTVQDVVNGMFRDGRPILPEPILAVVPAGTGCDLVRSFGLPGDLEGAARHLLGDDTYPMDVLKAAATGIAGERLIRYVHNVATIGLHAAAWERSARLPGFLGSSRRFLAFWGAYVTQRTRAVHIETDTRDRDLRAWSVVVGNGQFADGGLRLSPRSFPGDGIMDALVFTGPRSDAYRMLPRMFRHGDHVPDPGIAELRAKLKVAIDADHPMPVVADGVPLGNTPVTFTLIPQPIHLKL